MVVPASQDHIAAPEKLGADLSTGAYGGRCAPVIAGVAVSLLTLLHISVAVAADAPAGASSCSGCHAASSAVPRLVGVAAGQIVAAMQEFRNGKRPATVMDRIAKGFSESEITAIAAWYAAQRD